MRKVAVIVPLYNQAALVGRALKSVFAQTEQDFDLIVVDDGSSNGGSKIVAKMGLGRVRVVRQPNWGQVWQEIAVFAKVGHNIWRFSMP